MIDDEFKAQLMSGQLVGQEPSDLRETFKELNADMVDSDNFSSIDTRTRLTASQVPSLVALDLLTQCGVLPFKYNRIGRGVKRLSVSIQGKGRSEMVQIVQGIQEQKAKESSVVQRINPNGE